MTALDTTNLENLANLTFNDYKALHDIFQNRSSQYYAELQTQAYNAGLVFVENYGALAQDVAVVGTPRGEVINNFIKVYAEAASKDFSWGSEDRLRFQFELMQEDLDARQLDIANGGDGELNFNQTNEVYAAALSAIGLPPESSFFYTPTTQMAEYDPNQAEFFFQSTVAGGANGVFDIIQDSLLLGFGANISKDQPLSEIFQDYSDQAEWMTVTIEAMQDFVTEYGPNESTHLSDILETYQQLLYLASTTTGGIGNVAEWLENLPSLEDMLANISLRVPSWMSGLLSDLGTAESVGTPLVLDLDGDGIELVAVNTSGSVYWDIDVDGYAEASGWVTGGDGLLAIDLNADGVISDHVELFGDQTGSNNGFAALATYDTNSDGYITSADTQFDDLLVWVDENADGLSQEIELHTLDDLIITSIDLGYSNVSYMVSGNEVKQESTFTIDGNTHDIVDAWFAYDNTNAIDVQSYSLDIRTLFLPSLRGFGNVSDLHIAMSQDSTLLDMVEVIATANTATIFSSAFDLKGKMNDILYRWAGVDGVSPTSRGAYIDARKLEFLEELSGEEWLQFGTQANPGTVAADMLSEAYDKAFANFTLQILSQTEGKTILPSDAAFNLAEGDIDNFGDFDAFELFADFGSYEQNADTNDHAYLYYSGDGNKGIEDRGGTDQIILGAGITENDTRVVKAGSDMDFYIGADKITIYNQFSTSTSPDYRIETAVLTDGTILDLINNIVFRGTSGGETISTTANNDILIGLEGTDYLYGGLGDDKYLFDSGHGSDGIQEAGGSDTIFFGDGIEASDLTFSTSYSDLYIYYGSDQVTIYNQFNSGSSYVVENLEFEDGFQTDQLSNVASWSLGTASGETLNGTSSADVIIGRGGADTINGDSGADDLHGGDGDDTLDGDGGDDVIFGGAGADDLYGGSNQDVLNGGEGADNLWGESGADTFLFDAGSAFSASDDIKDFNPAHLDKFDVSDLLEGYDPISDAITDFVRITDDGTHSYLSIDVDGGADNFVQIAQISNRTGLTDEAALESSGTLITV